MTIIKRARPQRTNFDPPTVYVSGGVRQVPVGVQLEVRTWSALEEASWDDRCSKQQLIEEVVVAYLRERFPDRDLPLREEVRDALLADHVDEEAEEARALQLAPGVRHYEHDEPQWRRASRG